MRFCPLLCLLLSITAKIYAANHEQVKQSEQMITDQGTFARVHPLQRRESIEVHPSVSAPSTPRNWDRGHRVSTSNVQFSDAGTTIKPPRSSRDGDDNVIAQQNNEVPIGSRIGRNIREAIRNTSKHDGLLQELVAFSTEFIGTAVFAILALGDVNSLAKYTLSPGEQAFFNALSVSFALTVAARVYGSSFFNPGISVAKLVVGEITAIRAILLTLAQYGGAMSGAGIVRRLTGELRTVPSIGNNFSAAKAFGLEAIGGAIFIESVLTLTGKKHLVNSLAPFECGLALFATVLATSAYSGGSLNAALALASQTMNHDFRHAGLYQGSNYISGLMSGIKYRINHEVALLQEKVDPNPTYGLDLALDQTEKRLSLQRRRSQAFSTKSRNTEANDDVDTEAV